MMWFQYPPICSGLATPEHFWLHKRCISVNFFPCFFVGIAEFVYVQMYLSLNIDICLLLVRIDCVAIKPEWKLYFLEWKTHSSLLNLVPGTLEIAF